MAKPRHTTSSAARKPAREATRPQSVLDRLERAGYVQRVADPSDRRRVLVELTDRAQRLTYELMGKPLEQAARPLIDRYSEEQLELLIEFTRTGREMQERHAQWLRERVKGS